MTVLETTPVRISRDGSHDAFSHIVRGSKATVLQAMVYGHTVTAYCGKTWVPSRDPEPLQRCKTCTAAWEARHGRAWGT